MTHPPRISMVVDLINRLTNVTGRRPIALLWVGCPHAFWMLERESVEWHAQFGDWGGYVRRHPMKIVDVACRAVDVNAQPWAVTEGLWAYTPESPTAERPPYDLLQAHDDLSVRALAQQLVMVQRLPTPAVEPTTPAVERLIAQAVPPETSVTEQLLEQARAAERAAAAMRWHLGRIAALLEGYDDGSQPNAYRALVIAQHVPDEYEAGRRLLEHIATLERRHAPAMDDSSPEPGAPAAADLLRLIAVLVASRDGRSTGEVGEAEVAIDDADLLAADRYDLSLQRDDTGRCVRVRVRRRDQASPS